MLQDFRHVVVFDLREAALFDESQIRDSFNLNNDANKGNVQEVFDLSIKKAEEKEKKYSQLKKIRRYFIINTGDIDIKN